MSEIERRLFKDEVFNRKLWRLMLPIALQSLMLSAVAAGDALMLGRVEQDSMAAVSLATQVQFVQNMIITSVTAAASILGAQYWGKGDKRTIVDIFNMSLRLNGLISLVFFLLCVLIPDKLMLVFASEKALISIGADYLRIAGWSYLLTGITQCYLTTMKVTDHVARTAWISSSAVVLNLILNGVFIFGLLGFPAMGARGAAVATLISRIVEFVWAVASSYQKGFLHPDFKRFFHRDKELSRDFHRNALPLLGGGLFWGVGFTSYTAIMGHMGGDAAAANSIAAVVRDLLCCLNVGISSAGGIMVGNELGAGHLERGRVYGERLAKLSVLLGFLSTAIVIAVTPLVVHFMILTDEARKLLSVMMIIMAVYMIGRCINTVVVNGVFGAGGDTLFDMYSLAVCMWGIAIPLALLGAFIWHWPVPLVYACTCLDEVGKLPWVYAHFKRYKWVKDLTREAELGR